MGRSLSQTPSPARNSSASDPSTPFNSSFDFEEVLATPNSPLDVTRSGLWSPALCHESTTKKLQRSNATLKRDLDEANDQIDFLERRVTRAQMAQKQEKQQRLEAEAALNSWEAQLRLSNENMSKRIQLLQEEKELLRGELGGLKATLVSKNRELRVQRIIAGAAFKLSEDLQKWTTLERLETLVRSGEYERILALPTGMRLLEGPPPRPNDGYIEESAGERLSKTVNTVTAMGRKREDSTSPKKRICIHEDDDCRVEEVLKREERHERNVSDVGKRPRLLRANRIVNYDVERYYDNMAL